MVAGFSAIVAFMKPSDLRLDSMFESSTAFSMVLLASPECAERGFHVGADLVEVEVAELIDEFLVERSGGHRVLLGRVMGVLHPARES